MRENTDQKKSEYGHFLRSGKLVKEYIKRQCLGKKWYYSIKLNDTFPVLSSIHSDLLFVIDYSRQLLVNV